MQVENAQYKNNTKQGQQPYSETVKMTISLQYE